MLENFHVKRNVIIRQEEYEYQKNKGDRNPE